MVSKCFKKTGFHFFKEQNKRKTFRFWNNSNKVRELSLTSMDLFSISNYICSISDISGIPKVILYTVSFILSRFVFLIGACNLAGINTLCFFLFRVLIFFFLCFTTVSTLVANWQRNRKRLMSIKLDWRVDSLCRRWRKHLWNRMVTKINSSNWSTNTITCIIPI